MANWHCLSLLFTTLASGSFDVTRKDHGDYFIWYGNNTITCDEFSRYTASYESVSSRCKCNFPLTFSTQSNTCESFTDRVYYRLDRSNSDIDTSVSTVYGVCGGNKYCAFKSTVMDTKLIVTKLLGNEPLNSNSNCVVNFVEIIHDCIPRRVPLKLFFVSHHLDRKLYLKLHRTSSTLIKNLEGELFLLDISCTADGDYNKKMMFKYNGTRKLDKPGSFSNVSAYDPTKTCPDVADTTHSVLPDSTEAPNHAHWSKSKDVAIEVGALLTVLAILVTVVIISCVYYRKFRHEGYERIDDGGTDHDVDDIEAIQNAMFGRKAPLKTDI